MVESQLSYEKRLKDSDEIIARWRGESGVLKKKNSTINKECDELRKEIELLHSQQERFQEIIRSNQKDIDDLKRDVHQRDNLIKSKEKMLADLNKRTQELEKYKQALTHKMNELKMEIEPRETEIREKKERIFEMERELKTLQHNHLQAGLKLSELRDKFYGSEKELKIERTRAKTARAQLMRICSDIYEVSNYIQHPDKLKEEVMKLYHRYSNSPELKKTLTLDADVQSEFTRHREYFEKIITDSKSKQSKKKTENESVKLLRENVELITELNRLRKEYRETIKQNQEMQSILGISTRNMLPSDAKKKLEQAIIDKEAIDAAYKNKIERLEEEVGMLIEENQRLRRENS
jgi:cilia- and flagella-associated protein 57